MFHFAAWLMVIGSVAVGSEFGGFVTNIADMARILGLFFLVALFAGIVAALLWNSGERYSHPRARQNHFRRIRNQGRAAD